MPISKRSGPICDFGHEGSNLQSKMADLKICTFHIIFKKWIETHFESIKCNIDSLDIHL